MRAMREAGVAEARIWDGQGPVRIIVFAAQPH